MCSLQGSSEIGLIFMSDIYIYILCMLQISYLPCSVKKHTNQTALDERDGFFFFFFWNNFSKQKQPHLYLTSSFSPVSQWKIKWGIAHPKGIQII